MSVLSSFRDQPIARKALLLGLVPTLCAVGLVVALSTTATFLQVRQSQLQDLEAESSIVADNVAAALTFNDRDAAADTVNAFRVRNNLDAVCVFDATGTLFVSLTQDDGDCPKKRTTPGSGPLVYERPVMVDAREVGMVRLQGSFSELYAWMRRQAGVAATTLFAAVLVSFLLTRWLGRAITEPVVSLSATAEQVSTSGDYSVRARKMSDDELGRLTQSFNGMLDQIQQQHESLSTLLEREQESSRLKDQFLAAVSHELRTPLNAILGWVQIVRTTNPAQGTVDRALESLERNARSQARLIEDLIETSRAVTGKLQLKTEVVDLRAVVRGALDVVSPALAAKGIRVTATLPATAALVSGDPDRLQQVAWNLLSNALKFTPASGSIAVDVTPNGADFLLRVRDSGSGIPSEFLPFVFDRFRQADGSLTREQGGLGLGLAIVKDIVELHGGSVTAESPGRNQGAIFTIRLPRLVGSREPAEHEADAVRPVASPQALAGTRVLAVDDDRDALEIVRQALVAAGARVITAASGEQALAIAAREPFDVLVCDLAMPRMNGFEVLNTLRARGGAFPGGAFAIALTAHASPDDRRRTEEAGFQAHLAKPFALQDLVDAVAAGRLRS